jgi:hypothetical protein
VTLAFTVTVRADQLHKDNVPVHSSAIVQDFFLAKHLINQVCQSPLLPSFGSLRLLAFAKVKVAVESDDICECDGHTVHKLNQWRLTAD